MEFWDVGGSKKYVLSRSVFYQGINGEKQRAPPTSGSSPSLSSITDDERHAQPATPPGIVLVFDLSNRKSYNNLRQWIRELVEADAARGGIEEEASGLGRGVTASSTAGAGGGAGSSVQLLLLLARMQCMAPA